MENPENLLSMHSEDSEMGLRLVSTASARPYAHSDLEQVVVRLFDQFQGRVLNYVLTFGLCFHDAEDIVQETFLSLFRHLDLGRPRSNLNGWIFRVAHNLALKRRGRNRVFATSVVDEEVLAQQPHPGLNAEEEVAFSQTQRQLRAVFEVLPEQDRQCLYLRSEGLKYRQIADVLGISLGSVSLSLSRSLARIMRATGGR